jgi:hypothetical protein
MLPAVPVGLLWSIAEQIDNIALLELAQHIATPGGSDA